MPVDVLDGVLHGDDVAVPAAVDAVDHAGKRRGLAGAGRAGDEHQTLLVVRQTQHALRDAELVRIGQAEMDHPDHRGQRSALPEDVDPEAAQLRHGEGEVVVDALVQIAAVPAAQLIDRVYQLADAVWLQEAVGHAQLSAAAFEGHGKAGHQEDIRRVQLRCFL